MQGNVPGPVASQVALCALPVFKKWHWSQLVSIDSRHQTMFDWESDILFWINKQYIDDPRVSFPFPPHMKPHDGSGSYKSAFKHPSFFSYWYEMSQFFLNISSVSEVNVYDKIRYVEPGTFSRLQGYCLLFQLFLLIVVKKIMQSSVWISVQLQSWLKDFTRNILVNLPRML